MRVTTVGYNGSAPTVVAQVLEARAEPAILDITTRATLADALAWALEKAPVTVVGEV